MQGCGCEQANAVRTDKTAGEQAAPAATADSSAAGATPNEAGPAMLFLGTDTPLESGSVRILWLVEDQQQDIKLSVQALHKGKFVPVLVDDETHGLAQTGLMSLTFNQPPTQSDLFGETRYWLRVTPKSASNVAAWNPVISGAFLNAVWAEAAETRTSEILGSSDGSPNQLVALARPPVLDSSVGSGRTNSLELRVREPLSEEEVNALRQSDPEVVIKSTQGQPPEYRGLLPGYWVRWQQVIDPLDEDPGTRVYASDDVSGDVRFGDALHGKIPPRGVDNIVAMTYRRGGGAAANSIADRSALQVVAPLEGVEGVVVGLPAAGGANAATSIETLRDAPANLWTRGRALTAKDFESVALAYTPEIAQARCLESRRRRGDTRLVVVVRGDNPAPTRAMRRELQRYLLQLGSPALAQTGRFSVDAPKLKPCYIQLTLAVKSTEETGSLEVAVDAKLKSLFDPATGGIEIEKTDDAQVPDDDAPSVIVGSGWPLGIAPTVGDIAAALVDTPGLLGIAKIELFADEDYKLQFPAQIGADTLVTLAPGDIRITFEMESP